MVTVYGNNIDSAFTDGVSVVGIYTYGCMVWPNAEPWSGSGIGPEVHPGDYYISWTPTNVSGSFSIDGQKYSLEDYSGYFNEYDGNITYQAFKATSLVTVEGNAMLIGNQAFQNCSSLQSVSLSYASVIEKSAFKGCFNLSTVSLSRCLSIEESAFYNCNALKTVYIPECNFIGSYAFDNNSDNNLYVTVGGSDVVRTRTSCFGYTDIYRLNVKASLWNDYVNGPYWSYYISGYPDSTVYPNHIKAYYCLSYSGYYSSILSGWGPSSIDFSSAMSITSFYTDGVVISLECCVGMSELQEVSAPYCLNVGSSAFKDCTSLTTVYCPMVGSMPHVSGALIMATEIGTSAFYGCYNLQEAAIPAQQIRSHAFDGCSSLSMYATSSVCYTIDSYAFKNCVNMSYFMVGKGRSQDSYLTKLSGSTVFEGCTNLQSIYVPSSLYSAYKVAYGWSYFSDIMISY